MSLIKNISSSNIALILIHLEISGKVQNDLQISSLELLQELLVLIRSEKKLFGAKLHIRLQQQIGKQITHF